MGWIHSVIDDIKAIALRRRELFPHDDLTAADDADRERFKSATQGHCGICPLPADQLCAKDCDEERKRLEDGVTIAFPEAGSESLIQWMVEMVEQIKKMHRGPRFAPDRGDD